MRKTIIRNRSKIMDVTIPVSGAVVQNLEFKVPQDMLTLEEIWFGAVKQGAVEVIGATAKSFHLGLLSLHLNNKETHLLRERIQVKPFAMLKRKTETKPCHHDLDNNSLIQGVFIDDGNSTAYPYTLKIYFKGKFKNEVSE